MNVPDDLSYANTHEWLRKAGDIGTVGISDHAQHELTDVVFVELPKVGTEVQAHQQICVVESVKAASDIYSPVAGKVESVNEALSANPALLNTDPYGEGWIFKIRITGGVEDLKTPAQYREQIGG